MVPCGSVKVLCCVFFRLVRPPEVVDVVIVVIVMLIVVMLVLEVMTMKPYLLSSSHYFSTTLFSAVEMAYSLVFSRYAVSVSKLYLHGTAACFPALHFAILHSDSTARFTCFPPARFHIILLLFSSPPPNYFSLGARTSLPFLSVRLPVALECQAFVGVWGQRREQLSWSSSAAAAKTLWKVRVTGQGALHLWQSPRSFSCGIGTEHSLGCSGTRSVCRVVRLFCLSSSAIIIIFSLV